MNVYHEIPVSPDKRLETYRLPENLKPEVDRQITELLRSGFIEPSTSPMASPIVCVLKGKSGQNGVRLAVEFRYTLPDVTPLLNMSDFIQ